MAKYLLLGAALVLIGTLSACSTAKKDSAPIDTTRPSADAGTGEPVQIVHTY